jgi:hypothetical protein
MLDPQEFIHFDDFVRRTRSRRASLVARGVLPVRRSDNETKRNAEIGLLTKSSKFVCGTPQNLICTLLPNQEHAVRLGAAMAPASPSDSEATKEDDFVNSPISALRFIALPLRRAASTPRGARFARLDLGLFTKPSSLMTFYEFI